MMQYKFWVRIIKMNNALTLNDLSVFSELYLSHCEP